MNEAQTENKLLIAADYLGYGDDTDSMLEDMIVDSIAIGVCRNPECETCIEPVEPDGTGYHCDECGFGTVDSILRIAGII